MLSPTILFILGFYLISLAVFLVSIVRAPQGYEDDYGFHFGMVPARVIFARRRPATRQLRMHSF